MTQPPESVPGGVPSGSVPPVPPAPPLPPELPPLPPAAPGVGSGAAMPGGPTYAPPPPPPIIPGGGAMNPPPSGAAGVYQRMGGQSNLLGWLSLVFGIIATGCCCCWCIDGAPFIGGIPALILGFLHLKRVKDGRASMKWTAWVGIILAVIAIIGALVGFATHWQDDLYDQYKP
ncbi:hypothetical protein F4553_004957 [Allocatelliglobosispora scoriae]|uniref:DUF4190 domain-containing protein n=1 Tax=Allocatelliglobosispora scoriae TaxID=643052 RepID=A0A841BVT9_9ACTN|nr:DUF4190 domain-containing protein [Allocatelliglobosispora scoriae]MBB5871578.1 hypothetical protein [Allocatelliglobosispora scoriae]